MSRSYRVPYCVDNTCKKFGKFYANKLLRAKIRRVICYVFKNNYKDLDSINIPYDICNGNKYKRNYESWDICDYKFYVDNCIDQPRYKRK